MSLYKVGKDWLVRRLLDGDTVPRGLIELHQYFRHNDGITFHVEKQEDGSLVAVSTNFRYGSILTFGRTEEELNEKIKDAILTAFEIPSSYADEAQVKRIGEKEYALV